MTSPILQSVGRARSLFYFVIALLFTLLMSVVTIRFALSGGEALETAFLAILTFLLGFQTRRWYRQFRGISAER